LRGNYINRFRWLRNLPLRRALGVLAVGTLLMSAHQAYAADTTYTGEFNTLLRMGKDAGKRNLYPVYEYLRLQTNTTLKDGSDVSFQFGGWGRLDLADKSSSQVTDGDVQYALLSYQGAKNNLVINLGRQFVAEGVATELLDGLYLRQDLKAGFGAAAYVGKPVMTTVQEKTVDTVYGARLSHTMPAYYAIGASVLKSDRGSERYREEAGIDVWARPITDLDLTGRTSYNSITSGWMEHAYALSYAPLESLKLSVDLANINYRHYFHNMTMSAFSLKNGIINPDENMVSVGGSVAYNLTKNLTVTADFKNYAYNIIGESNYYGGKVSYRLPDSLLAGAGFYRMDGATSRLRYNELRAYVSKMLGKTDLTADFITLMYDKSVAGVKNSYIVTGAASHAFGKKVKVGADIEYSRTPDFDNQLRGILKLSYLFDTTP